MKQIKYLLMIVAIVISNNIFAQNAIKAKECLDKATAIVSNQGGLTARFALSQTGHVGRISGTISVKGAKFVAATPQTTIWFDGKTQWSYMKSTNEVNVSNPTEAQRLSMNPYSLMTMYRQGYTLNMTSEGGAYVVYMKATNPNRSVSEQGQKWTTITVSNIQKKNLSDGIFTFNKKRYPSAEIVDLR